MWKTRDGDWSNQQRRRAAILPRREKALKTMADSHQATLERRCAASFATGSDEHRESHAWQSHRAVQIVNSRRFRLTDSF
jgi:hypothetical protein